MSLPDLSIKRPVLISMALILFLLFGGLALRNMNKDLAPEVDIPVVMIQTVYAGSGPREIETQVTKKIEDAVSSITKIDTLQSYTMENVSLVMLMFELDKDIDTAQREVKEAVDAILAELPDDCKRPVIKNFDIRAMPIIDVVLSGDLPSTELFDLADKRLKERFSQIEGVANVSVSGGRERDIRVELENRTVLQNRISLKDLSAFLAAQNLNLPGGNFQVRDSEYTVRLNGEFPDVEVLRDQEVPTGFGMKRLGDIAAVRDAGEDVLTRITYASRQDGFRDDDVVLISLVKNKAGNTVEIAHAVKEVLPELQKELPAGCRLLLTSDSSQIIEGAVSDTFDNIWIGMLLTGLILFLFLHDLRSTLIAAVTMPMSILATFTMMNIAGFNLNIMSLMGLSTAVGILVTNSVVVLENIFRYRSLGHGRRESAGRGTAEVVTAVTASALTNVVVFLPIANTGGVTKLMFMEFGMTVVFATVFSLLFSFTLTPMLASLVLSEKASQPGRIGRALDGPFRSLENAYRRLLAYLTANKVRSGLAVAASVLLLVLSLGLGRGIGLDFIPDMDEGDVQMKVELPQGARLEETAALLAEVESRLIRHREVKHVVTTLGKIDDRNQGKNLALVNFKLVPQDDRKMSTDAFTAACVREMSDIPDAVIRIKKISAIMRNMGMAQSAFSFNLLGQDLDTMEGLKAKILDRIQDVPGVLNLDTSSRAGKPEITLTPDRNKLSGAGLTVYDLAISLRAAVEGLTASTYRDRGEEYDIRVTMADDTVDSPEEIGAIPVTGPAGVFRLDQLASLNFTEGNTTIQHLSKYKTIEFTGDNAAGVPLGNITSEINRRLADLDLPSGYKIEWGGVAEIMNEAASSMVFAFALAVLLTYMLLAATLESLTQPLIILATLPMAIPGVLGALKLTGVSMNIISMMSIVMLVGIVVNTAILMMDYTNILVRRRGMSLRDALVEACPTKVRPILMSLAAIVMGMLPMALGVGAVGREFRQPMGVVSIGGLIVSTVMALIFIPTLHYLTSRKKAAVSSDSRAEEKQS